jgi:hypothetical protein
VKSRDNRLTVPWAYPVSGRQLRRPVGEAPSGTAGADPSGEGPATADARYSYGVQVGSGNVQYNYYYLYLGDAAGPRRSPARLAPAYWATAVEIRQRTGVLTGRQDDLEQITSFAVGDEGYRWLAGDAWAGKTSLLAEAVTTLTGEVELLSPRSACAPCTGGSGWSRSGGGPG